MRSIEVNMKGKDGDTYAHQEGMRMTFPFSTGGRITFRILLNSNLDEERKRVGFSAIGAEDQFPYPPSFLPAQLFLENAAVALPLQARNYCYGTVQLLRYDYGRSKQRYEGNGPGRKGATLPQKQKGNAVAV